MKIVDELYGELEMKGVLEALILSKPVQRLKGVYQGGASYLVNKKWNVTRYEHSIGVMYLIKKLGGSIEEQIAGLLHDVSHTAFSHVIDYVFENLAEDYHEEIYHQTIIRSEIPAILQQYGFHYEDILFDHTKWRLLEQHAPALCADRIDYTLRDTLRCEIISQEEVQLFLNELTVKNSVIGITNVKTAEWFSHTYYKEVIDYFMHPLNIYGYDVLAKALKIALDKQLISLETLQQTDEQVLAFMRASKSEAVNKLLDQLHPHVIVEENKKNYDLHRKTKLRYIDPPIIHEHTIIPGSMVSDNIKKMKEKAIRKVDEGMYVRILSNTSAVHKTKS